MCVCCVCVHVYVCVVCMFVCVCVHVCVFMLHALNLKICSCKECASTLGQCRLGALSTHYYDYDAYMQDTQHAVLAGEDGDQFLHVLRRQTQDVIDLVPTQQVVAVLAVVVVVVHKVTTHKQLCSLHSAAQQQTNSAEQVIFCLLTLFFPFSSSCIPCTVFNILAACASLLPEYKLWSTASLTWFGWLLTC